MNYITNEGDKDPNRLLRPGSKIRNNLNPNELQEMLKKSKPNHQKAREQKKLHGSLEQPGLEKMKKLCNSVQSKLTAEGLEEDFCQVCVQAR